MDVNRFFSNQIIVGNVQRELIGNNALFYTISSLLLESVSTFILYPECVMKRSEWLGEVVQHILTIQVAFTAAIKQRRNHGHV